MSGLSLRANFGWMFLASIVRLLSQFAIPVTLARTVSDSAAGDYYFALGICAPIVAFTQLDLRVALVTDSARQFSFATYHTLRLLLLPVAFLIPPLVILQLKGVSYELTLVAFLSASLVATSVRDIWTAVSQKNERLDYVALGDSCAAVLGALGFAIILVATRSILLGVLWFLASRLVILVAIDIPRARKFVALPLMTRSKAQLWTLFVLVLPLGISRMTIALNTHVTRYFIEYHLDSSAQGVYGNLLFFLIGLSVVMTALTQAASPRLAKLYTSNIRAYVTTTLKILAFALAGMLFALAATYFWGDIFLLVMFGRHYQQYTDLLVVLCLGGTISIIPTVLGVAISSARFFRAQTLLVIFLLVTSSIAGALLIPAHGLLGAVCVVPIAASTNAIINFFLFLYVIREKTRAQP